LEAAEVSIIKNRVIEDFRDDPSIRKAGLITTREHPGRGRADHLGIAARLSATPARLGRPSPVLGADTEEILEALARINLPSYERRIVDVVIRKTYGFIDRKGIHKIWDRIAYSQFEKFTRIRRQHIHRSILKLLEKRVIERRPLSKRGDYEYRIQKDFDKWIGLSPMQVTKDNKIVTHRGYTKKPIQVTKLSPIKVNTKENNKYIKRASNRTEESKFEFSKEAERLARLFLQRSGVNILEFKKEHTLKSWID
ncbi:MAG: replication protein, partial [Deltaproteobacteria bacterium]|nr:replication protein [Deltaproteobacteria bacterium]